ncbi:MAG: glycosyltransferase family A protein [Oligoflexales bacterium]
MYKKEPIVTIGIPTYNRPKGLEETLRLVLQQTYKNLEVIVSDNCSPCASEVDAVMLKFNDDRIKFVRQKKNVGAMMNFHYLLHQASSEYFMWVADDDVIDSNLVEELVKKHQEDPQLATAISGFDVEDTMSNPPILTEFTQYLKEIPHENQFKRLENYLRQPEYQGKIRIAWGLAKTKLLQKSFEECLEARDLQGEPKSFELPMELRLLSKGNLAVVDHCLSHVKLLPTSNGKAELKGSVKQYLEMCRISFRAYRKAIEESGLSATETRSLLKILNYHELQSKVRIVPYYTLQQISPGLARFIKLCWFKIVGWKSKEKGDVMTPHKAG